MTQPSNAATRTTFATAAFPIEQTTVAANGQRFHIASAGPSDGPLLLLLHGFPEFSYGWRHQLPAFAALGYRVVAPDQRGYGLSTKPRGVAAYRIDALVADVLALADTLGHPTFRLVGHDWGGIVAWRLAGDFGHRVARLAILNAPNLDVAMRHARTHPGQLLKSAYVAWFQLPLLPEMTLAAMNHALLADALRRSSLPGTFDDATLDVYRAAWSQPDALTSMLAWYRALRALPSRPAQRIAVPTQIVWGDRDSALDASFAEESAALCDAVDVLHVPDATHWVHHERPDEVNDVLGRFFGPAAAAGTNGATR